MALFSAQPSPRLARLGNSVLLVVCLAAAIPATAAERPACQRASLDLDNVWLQSVAAYDDSILAVDPAELRVLRISPDGRVADRRGHVVEVFAGLDERPTGAPFVPTLIQRLSNGRYLVGNGADELLEVTPGSNVVPGLRERNFHVVGAVNHLEASRSATGQITGLFAWSATDDDHLISFADAAYGDGTFARGFVWLQRSDPSSFRFIRKVDEGSEEAKFYFILHPYLATIGDKGYFLAMKERPTIYEFDGQTLRSLGMPRALQTRPSLPPKQGASAMPALYAALENDVSPVGLYPWRGDLWLLGRRPRVEGGTEWTLHRIDPGDSTTRSRVLSTLYLPTTAEHVAIAPGDDYWSLLEKSSVKALGQQDVKALVRLPAKWLTQARSPLRRLNLSLCQ
jgi:hypothetical protein